MPHAPPAMHISELDYELPAELIAQEPLARRDESRILVLNRKTGAIEHSRFYKLGRYLAPGDLLVMNDTKVVPARLNARKESGGRVELLIIRPWPEPSGAYLAMIRGHRPPAPGGKLILDDGSELIVAGYPQPGRAVVISAAQRPLEDLMAALGRLALPHYIRREVTAGDAADYQTVYAARAGAIAAPTAGLHFTPELLSQLRQQGVGIAFITLHIGPGTFAPLRATEVGQHGMEAEWYSIGPQAAAALDHVRRVAGRTIAVGTSAVRALESYAITGDLEGQTGLFIYPGFRFKLVEGMITNFHMPRTTVLAMVMAFAGREQVLAAYREAIRRRYRFLSYGDAMIVL